MRINRKGAIEMSMTTIIIVILGVTLLSLGLMFVRNIFGGMSETTDSVLGSSESMVNELFGESDAILSMRPDSVTVKQGDTSTMKLYVRNTGNDPATFTLSMEITDGPSTTAPWIRLGTKSKQLQPGQAWQKAITLVPTKTDAKPGIYSITINCAGPACEGESFDFTVTVKGG